ncbi:uncharacterized protein LOC122251142 [Penaeus japonicus]|uniref:uncharacterized protein LOC122251142 n=1 Tax=Penaeus japonicus TaxID=27405 RepID=UPI001C70D525|nr:uncharacterized protein LOC122251142 [Penaeus japonicus]
MVVYCRSFEEHLEHLEETLDLLSKADFCLNIGKSSFATHEFQFLGYLITKEGIQPDPAKVEAIRTMKPPQNVRGVRQFLGCTGFFRKHIPIYAMIAAPLTSLTRKGRSFRWKEEHQQAFEELQRRLMSAPVLRKPDFNRPFEVHSDASQVACLMQRDGEGVPHDVAYFSRKLREVERRYPVIDIEALAVVEAVRNFDAYLNGKSFVIYTDHRPLVYKIAEEQQKDPLWTEILQYLQEQRLPRRRTPFPLEEFEVSDGLLYHLRHLPDRVIQQLVIPRTMRDEELWCERLTQDMERVSADLLDLQESRSGYRYVLVIVEHLTRYLQLIPLKNKDAETVANAFVEKYVTLFGPPNILVTDSGGEFKNRLFSQVCEMLKIKLGYTTAFHPQANGMVERSNRVIKDALATLVGDHPDEWDELLPYPCLALNTAIHRSTGQPLLYLMIGLMNWQEIDEGSAQRFHERLKEARGVAVETARLAQFIWAEDYNQRVRQKFAPAEGDFVLIREYARWTGVAGRALGSRWSGPLRVKKQVGPVTFICQSMQPPYREKSYHCNQMKRYVVQEELEFFPEAEVDDGIEDPSVPGANNRE